MLARRVRTWRRCASAGAVLLLLAQGISGRPAERAPDFEGTASLDGARPLSLATADFDEDGVPDLVSGHAAGEGGIVVLRRGNVGAIYPNAAAGATDAPFLPEPRIFATPVAPDFVAAGDFDNDGHRDVAVVARGGSELHLLAGTGGGFAPPRAVALPGRATALACGEMDRADGLEDLVVAVTADDGAALVVFEGPGGALGAPPERIALGATATSLALGQLDDDYPMDLAVTAGDRVTVVHGRRDRRVAPRTTSTALEASTRSATAEDPPVAVLPMRLNADAVDDLVVLSDGASAPTFVLSEPRATFTVTTTADTGPGSLRAAIEAANASAGADTITFNIPGGGVKTIAPATALPAIEPEGGPVTIDATGQQGSSPTPLVVLSGANAPVGTSGLIIAAPSSVVRGLVINGFRYDGKTFTGGRAIVLTGEGGSIIEGNLLGLDASGTAVSNLEIGVEVVISPNNTIGGTTAAARNVIAGCLSGAILVDYDETATGNVIRGNYIGTDRTGSVRLATGSGIYLSSVPGNTVGGTTAGARNVIVSDADAVGIAYEGADGNLIQGNAIGTAADGTTMLGNTGFGVSIGGGASDNTVGGTASGAGNVIAFSRTGVSIGATEIDTRTSTGNTIQRNAIFSSEFIGIDHNVDFVYGPDQNDDDDVDTGPNRQQNYPELTSASTSGGATRVRGTLSSAPSTTYAVELFSNPTCDVPSGFGEGQTYVGTTMVATGANGIGTIDVTLSSALAAGRAVTATATDPDGNTSEFSSCVEVGGSNMADLALTMGDYPDPVVEGGAFTYNIYLTNTGPGTATNITITDPLPSSVTFESIVAPGGWNVQTPAVGSSGTVTLTSASLPRAASPVFQIVVRVRDNTQTGTLFNTATVASDADPNAGNNSAMTATDVNGADASADLSVEASATPATATTGSRLVYTLLLRNAGPNTATDVALGTSLPQGTGFVDSVPDATVNVSPGGPPTVVWRLASLESGATRKFVLAVSVDVATSSPLDLTATATTSTRDPNANNNADTVSVQTALAGPTADLAVSVSASQGPVTAGDALTYTMVVTNQGPSAAENVILFDALPNSTSFLSATTTRGTLDLPPPFDFGALVCSVGSLASGASATVTLDVQVNAGGGSLTNRPFAANISADAVPANNTATAVTSVASAGTAVLDWDPPDEDAVDALPPPRNLTADPSDATVRPRLGVARARRAPEPIAYNIYASSLPNVPPSPSTFIGSVPPSQTSTTAPFAPGGSFFVVTAVYPSGESPPTNEAGTGATPGASVSFVRVTGGKITAKGTGFTTTVQVFVDGIPFVAPAKVKQGKKVTQKGNLLTGQSIGAYAPAGRFVTVTFRNSDRGTTSVTVARQ